MAIVGKVYLIRHGEKTNDGLGLTSVGEKQINYLAKRLKKIGIDKIYSSDIPRCKMSAKIISKALGEKIIYDKSLREVESDVFNYPKKYPNEILNVVKFSEKIKKMHGNVLLVKGENQSLISPPPKILDLLYNTMCWPSAT